MLNYDAPRRPEPVYLGDLLGNKYDIVNYQKISPEGEITTMTDAEAKILLKRSEYKEYKKEMKRRLIWPNN